MIKCKECGKGDLAVEFERQEIIHHTKVTTSWHIVGEDRKPQTESCFKESFTVDDPDFEQDSYQEDKLEIFCRNEECNAVDYDTGYELSEEPRDLEDEIHEIPNWKRINNG